MCVQYLYRNQIAASSSIYTFHFANAPDGARKFVVTVQVGSFRPVGLKLQDGSQICITCLSQEFQSEAEDSRAEAHLLIRDRNIKKDLGQHHPQIEHGKEGLSLT